MPKSQGYVSAEYLRKAAQQIGFLKERSYELMDIKPGAVLLDAGCGAGMDTVPLANFIGDSGRVVGIDIDEEMLQKADRHAEQEGVARIVEHKLADVAALDFADDSFDAIRAERLFQVLPESVNAETVLAELVRVTKPGGAIVLLDADWGTFSVDFSNSELERRLMTFFASQMRPNGFAGRQMYAWGQRAGLQNISMESAPLIQTDYEQAPVGPWLQVEAVKAGIATQQEVDDWATELLARNEQGQFYCSVNMMLLSAVKSEL